MVGHLWAVGVAATNAYIIYDRLYEEEKKKKEKMPKKWDHMQFLQELIHDFVGWGAAAEVVDDDVTATSVSESTTATTRRGSSYSSIPAQPRHFFDLTTEEGREDFISLVKVSQINRNRMEGAFFSCRFDGNQHNSVPIRIRDAYCQYCRYKWSEMSEYDREHNRSMQKTRGVDIERCLTCNVNLCWKCRMTWHGVSLDVVSSDVSRRHG